VNETPPQFRAEPEGFSGGIVRVRAVVGDLFETLAGRLPDDAFLGAFVPSALDKAERNRMLWVLAACRLFWHSAFRAAASGKGPAAEAALRRFFLQELPMLASAAPVEGLLKDEERREELIRRGLRALDMRLPGEGEVEARDRLKQVDSVERQRLLVEVQKRQEKLRREAALRKKAAEEEAASKAPRE
jgi:hypothetical protein